MKPTITCHSLEITERDERIKELEEGIEKHRQATIEYMKLYPTASGYSGKTDDEELYKLLKVVVSPDKR